MTHTGSIPKLPLAGKNVIWNTEYMANRHKKPEAFPHHFWLVAAILIVLIVSAYLLTRNQPQIPTIPTTTQSVEPTGFTFDNATIMLNNMELSFTNGSYRGNEQTDPDHTAQMMNVRVSDLGNHAAAILVDNPGGSGTFSYLIGGSMKDGKKIFSSPIPLGDRIKVTSVTVIDPTEENNGMITVGYLDRPTGAPMSSDPTHPVTVTYAFEDNGNLIEVLN